jgi:hypothetical protein
MMTRKDIWLTLAEKTEKRERERKRERYRDRERERARKKRRVRANDALKKSHRLP